MKKTLILTPLPLELKALLARMKELGHSCQCVQAGPLSVHEFRELNISLGLGGHGKTQFGIQTQFLLDYFKNVDAVICAGSAGSLSKTIKAFDVIAATKTIEHDYRLKFFKKMDPEFAGDPVLLEKILSVKSNGFTIHTGPIASGDEDILDKARAMELIEQTGAFAVAWEGAGGARAAQFNGVPFLEIRGITDMADSSSTDQFISRLKITMNHVCDTFLSALNSEC